MKSEILSEVFAEFCETQIHFDSLLSKVEPHLKSKVAVLLGAFLRRPLTIADFLGIPLASASDAFWSMSYTELKENEGIHAVFASLWDKWDLIPNQGSIQDFPPAFIQELREDWGDQKASAMAALLTQDPLTTIRLHRKAFDQGFDLKPEVLEWFKDKKLPKSRPGNLAPAARLFKGYAAVQKNELFKRGFFEIQDEGSQVMALYALYPEAMRPLLESAPRTEKNKNLKINLSLPELPPLTVVDACAGAGGKTLALADLLKGKGRVYAYDVYERKIRALKIRADRAEERNIQGVPMPSEALSSLEKFAGTADVVLVDAPCSGFGVLRRNPDIKWTRKPSEIERVIELSLPELQQKVLKDYAGLVKPGGRLVFGVCTFSKKETTECVNQFLALHPEFEHESQGFTGPFETDGFFMASLKRK